MSYLYIFIICYFLGSFPTAFLVVKVFTGKNILEYGTGNVGTMNTHRATNNKFLTLLVLLGDLLKGGLAFEVGNYFFQAYNLDWSIAFGIAGFAVILGHNYSIYLKFKGGKGLATGAGFILLINYWLVLAWIGIFLIVVLLTRYMVLGQMIASFALPFLSLVWGLNQFYVILLLAFLVCYKHYPRMKNVLNGTEPKMYYREKKA